VCGILGIVNLDAAPVDRELLETCTNTMAHRGPDGVGYHVHKNVGLGHRRLSIIDLSSGAQPMSNEDESIWITFNGEIYNYPDLKKELEAKGHRFRTNSDTEVIIHGYEEWGENVLPRLRGMFAFGILDEKKREMFLARDRLGKKPLVYYTGRDRFVFSSEIKAIVKDREIPREINLKGLNDYFECGYVPAPETIYKNIWKLKPAHFVKIRLSNPGDVRQVKYWQLNYDPDDTLSEDEIINTLVELLRESIRIRLMSDVPLGVLLSGGVDSSTVVRLMADVAPERIKTFSIGFNEKDFSETAYSRQVARQIGSEHFEYVVTPDIRELIPKLVYHFDEPFADASAIPTYYVSKMARQNVTVCLSGDGGDETFAGYDRYSHCMGMTVFDFMPEFLRKAFFGGLHRMYPGEFKGKTFIGGLARSSNERFLDYMRNQYGYLDKRRLFSREAYEEIGKENGQREYLKDSFNNDIRDPLTRYLDVDIRTYLPNDILTKVDITSMMNSLEVRVPILDHKLLEFVATIPSSLKLKKGTSKYILKQAMAPLLPPAILRREKMGFGVPLRSWMANELRDIPNQYLLDKSKSSGILNPGLLREIVLDNEKRLYKSPLGGKLWWVLFFEMWYQDVFRIN